MIDIHSHILPNIDDGAASIEEMIAMARLAVEGGVSVMFATPHIADRGDLELAKQIPERVAVAQALLTEAEIPLTLVPGAEVSQIYGILPAISDGIPLGLGPAQRYLLLELPFFSWGLALDDIVFSLQTHGITPILAHPERVLAIQQNPQLLEELVFRGALLQITTTSVLGLHGPVAKDTAYTLLKLRWAHFLASDAHSPRRRCPGSTTAATALASDFSADIIASLTRDNAQHVLDGEPVFTDPLPYRRITTRKRHW